VKVQRKALIVEDEVGYSESAEKLLKEANYYVKIAKDADTAIDYLNKELFHVALVDIQLFGPDNNIFGIKKVLPKIHSSFPDCYRLIYTSHATDKHVEIIQSLSLPNRIAHGCYMKDTERLSSIPIFVNSIWDTYIKINDNLDIKPNGFELKELLKKIIAKNKNLDADLNILVDSFLSVIGRLFYADNNIEELIIEPFKEGFSKTILLKVIAKSSLLKSRPGKQVVIKFGLKEEISKESSNFDKYVQWYLTQNQTIQKIAFQSFNNYAAMLFTFAGDSPQNIFTFADYIKDIPDIKKKHSTVDYDGVAKTCITNMFNPDIHKQEWYHPDVIEKDRNKFISDYYLYEILHQTPSKLNSEFFEKQMLQSTKSFMTLRKNKTKIYYSDLNEEITNPLEYCCQKKFVDEYNTCIIHGDLNSHNIIVRPDGNWYLLDYAHTGRGHVFQDFINLELSIRDTIFWNNNIPFTMKEILNFEKSIINVFDYSAKDNNENEKLDIKMKFVKKAEELIRQIRHYAILNFPQEEKKLYLVGLFYLTLDWIAFHVKIEQKRHFLILAGLLADELDG
jgi:DNA-binding NarL/FixJ family response regulator